MIINMTPHDVVIKTDERDIVIPSSGIIRLEEEQAIEHHIDLDGIKVPVYRKKMMPLISLPEEKPDTYYIVSLVVAQKFPERNDFLTVNEAVRDEKGRIIGCRSFAKI